MPIIVEFSLKTELRDSKFQRKFGERTMIPLKSFRNGEKSGENSNRPKIRNSRC